MPKIYVGSLPAGIDERELDGAFAKFGKITKIWVARNPPGFAFVELEDIRDAENAVKEMDGATLGTGKIRCEMSKQPASGAAGGPRACYTCGGDGHLARDCPGRRGGFGGGDARRDDPYRRDRSPPRRRSPPSPHRRGGRSPSPRRRERSRSRERGGDRERERSRGRGGARERSRSRH